MMEGGMMYWSMMEGGMMYWGMMNKRGLMMHWGMVKWSRMDRGMMNWSMMNRKMVNRGVVERRVTNAEVPLQAPALSVALSKYHLVEAVAQSCRDLGGLIPGGLGGLVHGLRVHGTHACIPSSPRTKA